MAPLPTWSVNLRPPQGEPNYPTEVHPPGPSFYSRSWLATLIGTIAVTLSCVLWIIYWEVYLDSVGGDGWDYETYEAISRLGRIAGYAFYIGAFLVLLGVVFALRGLMVEGRPDRFVGTLRSKLPLLALLALLAGVLYLASCLADFLIGESVVDIGNFGVLRLIYYPARVVDVILALMAFIVVNELNRRRL